MKRLLILGLCLTSSIAIADCHVRSTTRLTKGLVDFGPTDVQLMLNPDPKGSRCALQYRVHTRGQWQTAEGIGYGKTETDACAQAIDISRGSLLEEPKTGKVASTTDMVCSDLPEITVRPVRIGEVIWESEVDIHPHPDERKYFYYKMTQCRYFAERNSKDQNLLIYQGVICKINSTQNSKWRVVDKY